MDKYKKYYFDYAATTPVDPEVVKVMLPYFKEKYGNPASLHTFGEEANQAVEEARETLAGSIGALQTEIYFTSSATESNNWALKGVAAANKSKGNRIIISPIEHHCVLNAATWLGKNGFEVVQAEVDSEGFIKLNKLKDLMTPNTILVSIMHSNNEIGTIQPIAEIGKICHEKGIVFHTDAAQSLGKVPLDVKQLNVDLLTASSHKIYGPKGVAFLYIRKGTQIDELLHGGGQERGKRSSTLNVPGIIGFAKAAAISITNMEEESKRQEVLRDEIIDFALKNIPNTHLNGPREKRLCNNIGLRFEFIEGESLLMELDSHGIAVSTSSACSSPKLEPSHVLLACGISKGDAHGSIRISIGRYTTQKDVEYFNKTLKDVVTKLRDISPLNPRNN